MVCSSWPCRVTLVLRVLRGLVESVCLITVGLCLDAYVCPSAGCGGLVWGRSRTVILRFRTGPAGSRRRPRAGTGRCAAGRGGRKTGAAPDRRRGGPSGGGK